MNMPHHLFDTFFGCPKLNFDEMSRHLSTNPFSPPPIKLPFPPPITAQDIVLKRPSSKICSRSPNAFFIYRKAYFDQLALLNRRFKMTDVSKLVSLYWKNERREVKEAYKKIAQEVELELNERRKRDLAYPNVNSNFKIARRKSKSNNNVSKKKCEKMTKTTDNQSESVRFEKDKKDERNEIVENRQSTTHFEFTFGSDMQPLKVRSHNELENYLMSNLSNLTLDDTVSSTSDEPNIVNETYNDNFFATLDQNDVKDYTQNYYDFSVTENNNINDYDTVCDPIPAQSQINQLPVEYDDNSGLLNDQNVAFDEFCFDDNTNLNWYLQNFV